MKSAKSRAKLRDNPLLTAPLPTFPPSRLPTSSRTPLPTFPPSRLPTSSRRPVPALPRSRRTSRTAVRRIAVITGTRAEYGLLRSTLAALAGHAHVVSQLVVTGMHLLPRYGRTIDDIRADGWPIAASIPMQRGDDRPLDQAVGLARGVAGIAAALEHLHSDVVLVLGDRIEALAGALAATTTGRLVAHIHGGDVAPGDFDGPIRDAITKLAHIHFPATSRAAQRLIALGEDQARIHCCGAPGLDDLRRLRAAAASAAVRRVIAPAVAEDYALVVQHPCGRAPALEARGLRSILAAVDQAGLSQIIIYPNSDRGQSGIVAEISRHATRRGIARPQVAVARSVPRAEFLRLLLGARVLIGNSSAGLIEAPFAGVPVVNVGMRQRGREPGGPHIHHAAESAVEIRAALAAALRAPRRRPATSVYGDGRAGQRIADYLARAALHRISRQK